MGPDAKVRIEPEEGYSARSRFGLAKCGPTDSDYLVRLADVVRWYMASPRELPFVNAVEAVCARIDEDSIAHVYLVNSQSYAQAAAKDSPWNKLLNSAEEQEWTFQKRCAADCVRELRSTWCGDKHWMAKVLNDPEYASDEYDPYSESLFDYWERKGERDGGPLAGAYAIRFAAAHALWGWGRAAVAVALPDMVAGTVPAPAIQAQDVADWPSLVRYRLQFAGIDAQKRPAWLPNHVALLAGRLHEEYQAGHGKGALGRLATELSATRQALAGLLQKHKYSSTTGKADQAAATPFSGLGARGTKAA